MLSKNEIYYNYKDTYGDIIEIEADTYEQAYEQAYDNWIEELMDTYYGDMPLMACTDIVILGLDPNLEDEDGNPKIISVFNEVLTIDNR